MDHHRQVHLRGVENQVVLRLSSNFAVPPVVEDTVGLTSLELFDKKGTRLRLTKDQLNVRCGEKKGIERLLTGGGKSIDAADMWTSTLPLQLQRSLTSVAPPRAKHLEVIITLKDSQQQPVLMKLWNYNHPGTSTTRELVKGVNHARAFFGNRLVWHGEVDKGSGSAHIEYSTSIPLLTSHKQRPVVPWHKRRVQLPSRPVSVPPLRGVERGGNMHRGADTKASTSRTSSEDDVPGDVNMWAIGAFFPGSKAGLRTPRQHGTPRKPWNTNQGTSAMSSPAQSCTPSSSSEVQPICLQLVVVENKIQSKPETSKFLGPYRKVRPYMPNPDFAFDRICTYPLWLGGASKETVRSDEWSRNEQASLRDLKAAIDPLFMLWKSNRTSFESFWNFAGRTGYEESREEIKLRAEASAAKDELDAEKRTNSESEVQIEALQETIERLKARCNSLDSRLDTSVAELAIAQLLNLDTSAQLVTANATIATMSEQAILNEQQVVALRPELQDVRDAVTETAVIETAAAEEQVAAIEQLRAQVQRHACEMTATRTHLSGDHDQLAAAHTHLPTQMDSDSLQELVTTLTSQLEADRQDLQALHASNARLQEEATQWYNEVQASVCMCDSMAEDLSRERARHNDLVNAESREAVALERAVLAESGIETLTHALHRAVISEKEREQELNGLVAHADQLGLELTSTQAERNTLTAQNCEFQVTLETMNAELVRVHEACDVWERRYHELREKVIVVASEQVRCDAAVNMELQTRVTLLTEQQELCDLARAQLAYVQEARSSEAMAHGQCKKEYVDLSESYEHMRAELACAQSDMEGVYCTVASVHGSVVPRSAGGCHESASLSVHAMCESIQHEHQSVQGRYEESCALHEGHLVHHEELQASYAYVCDEVKRHVDELGNSKLQYAALMTDLDMIRGEYDRSIDEAEQVSAQRQREQVEQEACIDKLKSDCESVEKKLACEQEASQCAHIVHTDLLTSYRDLQMECQGVRDQLKCMEDVTDGERCVHTDLEMRHKELQDESERVRTDLSCAQEACKQHQRDQAEQGSSIKKLELDRESVEKELVCAQTVHADLLTRYQDLQIECQGVRDDLEFSEQESRKEAELLTALNLAHATLKSTYASATDEVARLHAVIDESRQQEDQLKAEHTSLQCAHKCISDDFDRAQLELSRGNARIDELQSVHDRVCTRVNSLKRQLASAQSALYYALAQIVDEEEWPHGPPEREVETEGMKQLVREAKLHAEQNVSRWESERNAGVDRPDTAYKQRALKLTTENMKRALMGEQTVSSSSLEAGVHGKECVHDHFQVLIGQTEKKEQLLESDTQSDTEESGSEGSCTDIDVYDGSYVLTVCRYDSSERQ